MYQTQIRLILCYACYDITHTLSRRRSAHSRQLRVWLHVLRIGLRLAVSANTLSVQRRFDFLHVSEIG